MATPNQPEVAQRLQALKDAIEKHLENLSNQRRKSKMDYRKVMQLSEAIANKLEIPSHIYYKEDVRTWLVDDPARMLTLALEHRIDLDVRDEYVEADTSDFCITEVYEEHKGDKTKAGCHAIARAYGKQYIKKAYDLLKIEG